MVPLRAEISKGNMGRHARPTSKGEFCLFHASKLSFKGESCWIAATRIVEDHWLSWSWLSECCGKVKSCTHSTKLLAWLICTVHKSSCHTTKWDKISFLNDMRRHCLPQWSISLKWIKVVSSTMVYDQVGNAHELSSLFCQNLIGFTYCAVCYLFSWK